MIVDSQQTVIVSSLGWVDRDALWTFDIASGMEGMLQVGDADWIQVIPGDDDYVSILQHRRDGTGKITIRRLDALSDIIAEANMTGTETSLNGESEAWKNVPLAYITHPYLVRILPVRGRWERQELPWYGDDYDLGYQGLVGVVEIPGRDELIISVQRDSHPVIYHPEEERVVGKLELAGRRGNPCLRFRKMAKELWADDYDSLLRINPDDWSVMDALRIQGADVDMRQFIGNWSFTTDEKLCAVARPFSGDVALIDTKNFKIKERCATGGQPLECALLDDGRIIARDWKTGDLLQGKRKRRWFR
jgi:hypothetical protein